MGEGDAQRVQRQLGEVALHALDPAADVVGLTHEGRDEDRGGLGVEFGRRAGLRDLRVAHDDDPVGDGQRLGLVMRDVDHGEAESLLQRADLLPHAPAQAGVEVRQRLVERQHLRLQHQGAGDRDALLLAARHLRLQVGSEALQADRLQRGLGLGMRLPPPGARGDEAIGDVVQDGHVGEGRVGLEHHGDVALACRQQRDVAAADGEPTLGRLLEARDHAQQRRLAAAGGTEQRHLRASPR